MFKYEQRWTKMTTKMSTLCRPHFRRKKLLHICRMRKKAIWYLRQLYFCLKSTKMTSKQGGGRKNAPRLSKDALSLIQNALSLIQNALSLIQNVLLQDISGIPLFLNKACTFICLCTRSSKNIPFGKCLILIVSSYDDITYKYSKSYNNSSNTNFVHNFR